MSAIAGIVALDREGAVNEQDLRAMLTAMEVRGERCLETYESVGARAAVGRIAYGPDAEQTACGPGGWPRVLMVGELYNEDAQAAPCFAAYLLERYQNRPWPDFAAGLNGSFAAVIVDDAAGSVSLLTDHMCSCPIFTRTHEGRFYFATEVKALVAPEHLPCRPNVEAVLSLLSCKQFLGSATLVEGVGQLDYSTVCRVAGGQVCREQVWRFAIDDEPPDPGERACLQRLEELLYRAVQRCTRRGRTGVLLSGGNDSRTIVCFLPRAGAAGLVSVTYTARSPGQRHRLGDVAVAARLAALVGLPHHVVQYDPMDVLDAVRQSVHDADAAAGSVFENIWDRIHAELGLDHVLIGDECFGLTAGLIHETQVLECVTVRPLRAVPVLWPYVNPERLEEFLELSGASCRALQAGRLGRPPHNQVDELWHSQGLVRWFGPKRRSLARHGLNVRRPLVDLEVLEFIRTLPYRYRRGKWLVRKAMARANRRASRLPRARHAEHVSYGPAFAALENDGGHVSRFVLEDNPLLAEYLHPRAVRELIARVAASGGAAGGPDRASRLAALVPPRWRSFLVAKARRYLRLRAPTLTSPPEVLHRIAIVAHALRHVYQRCRGGLDDPATASGPSRPAG